MSMNQNFEEMMEAGVTNLVDGADVNASSAHATYVMGAEQYPENITPESLAHHLDFINNTGAQVNAATAQLARQAYEQNNDITNFDGTLDLGCVVFNSQHTLKQDLGDTTLYGQSTTTTDYVFGDDLNAWQDQMNASNAEAAAKLFS